jgi:hypothetical protein
VRRRCDSTCAHAEVSSGVCDLAYGFLFSIDSVLDSQDMLIVI